MDFIGQLWLPIVLSAFIVFIASAIIWMAAPHHKTEWLAIPGEDDVLSVLRKSGAAPGGYQVPKAWGSAAMKDPAFQKKVQDGTVATIYLKPGSMNMGPMLAQQFVFFLVVGFFVAYLAHHTLAIGADYLPVFRVTGTAAFMAYFLGTVPESIWFGRPWKSVGLGLIDALIYALLTAGTFGWLWPR